MWSVAFQEARGWPFKVRAKVPPGPEGSGIKLETPRFKTQGAMGGSMPQTVATHSPWASKMLTDSEPQPRAGVEVAVRLAARVPVGVAVAEKVMVGVTVAVVEEVIVAFPVAVGVDVFKGVRVPVGVEVRVAV